MQEVISFYYYMVAAEEMKPHQIENNQGIS